MLWLNRFIADESGIGTIEYALVIGVVSIAAITAWGALGNTLENTYSGLTADVTDAR